MIATVETLKPVTENLPNIIHWWRTRRLKCEKGGSFNEALYLKIIEIRTTSQLNHDSTTIN